MQRITALILAITLLFTFGSTFVLADDAYEADSTLEESSASELSPENVVPKATISPDSELTSSPKSDDALSVSPEVSQESTPQPMADPVKLEYEVLSDYETGGLYLFPVPDGDEITQEYSEQHCLGHSGCAGLCCGGSRRRHGVLRAGLGWHTRH